MPAELATTLTATDDDRLLQAEAAVRDYCGWHIAPVRSESVVLAGSSNQYLLLPSLLVTAVTTVLEDEEEVSADGYSFTRGGIIRRDRGYLWGCEAVEVFFTHGYTEPPPAVTAVVQAMAYRATQNPGSLIRSQVGPFSDTYSQTGTNQSQPLALLEGERTLLAPYRLPKRL